MVVALVIVAVVATIAVVVRRRRVPDAPTQRRFSAPEQLDRNDFTRPEAAWLLAVFTSASCDVCRTVVDKASVLDSDDVAVENIEYTAKRSLHERYTIEAVPTAVIADHRGVVAASFLGPVTATDLWAAMAEVREPGSTPRGDACQHD